MVDLFYREIGSGAPLILVHGLFGSSDNVGALARLLAEEYRVIVPDLRNHGRSPHTDHHSYSEMAADIFQLMDKLGMEDATLIGHSMGGKTVMQCALDQPERVNHLVVLDIAPVAYPPHHTRIFEGLFEVQRLAPASRNEVAKILNNYDDNPEVSGFLATNWRRNDAGTWGWRINLSVLHGQYDAIMQANTAGGHGPYTGPVLFLAGALSDYMKPDQGDAIKALFPKAEAKVIQGVGHWLHAQKPELLARQILRFLER